MVFLLLYPVTVSTQRGCCSSHGGVVGCSSNGKQICADGSLSPSCTCTPPAVYGCTDYKANNYNPNANKDDGSCTYTVYGCTTKEAINYNSNANASDGSCIFQKEIKEQIFIPFETIYTQNKDLVVESKEGIKEITYQIQYNEQNIEIKRETVSEIILEEPRTQVVFEERSETEKEAVEATVEEKEEENPIFTFLYIGIFISNLIRRIKQKEKKCIINKIFTTKLKYLWLIIYFLLIIPSFIDFVILCIKKNLKGQIMTFFVFLPKQHKKNWVEYLWRRKKDVVW